VAAPHTASVASTCAVAYWADDRVASQFLAQCGIAAQSLSAGAREAPRALLVAAPPYLDRLFAERASWRPLHRILLSDTAPRNAAGSLTWLPLNTPPTLAARFLTGLLWEQRALDRVTALEESLATAQSDIQSLNRIGRSLSAEHDTARLLEQIVQEGRRMTESDAGSLYLVVEDASPEEGQSPATWLAFKVAQNDSLPIAFQEFRIPLRPASIAGYVAATGGSVRLDDAYAVPPALPFTFNTGFDSKSGYRTRSILAVPMINPQGRVVGVLQLINRKRSAGVLLRSRADVDLHVISYSERDAELVTSLASQAAVAVDNSALYDAIQKLFEGFVRASVSAIEARDPATSGHSFRVADLTLGLAEAVDRVVVGSYGATRFSAEQMRELRYAALLHDFGKVSVREEVLVKARKLYPQQLDVMGERFSSLRASVREQDARRRFDFLLKHGAAAFEPERPRFDAELATQLAQIAEVQAMVRSSNEPTVLPEGDFARLQEFARLGVEREGELVPFLQPEEVRLLSIPTGTLDEEERRQIESHVVHSYNFLRQIPWTREMREVAIIARGHHEKLDGSGYPNGVLAAQIPVQTRMMTIADIFDALAASDRPYKRAVPVERALSILESEVKSGMLDADLFQLFLEAKVFELLNRPRSPA